MKDLVIVVHGGNAGFREDDEIKHRDIIKNTYSIDQGVPTFGEVLDLHLDSERFDVVSPIFPQPNDANYGEWIRFLEQLIAMYPHKYNRLILVGHSLGTVTLQKYLAEHEGTILNHKVDQLHLVGSCLKEGNFNVSDNWEIISNAISNISIYHSEDDPVCPFSWGEQYHQGLPASSFHIFKGFGHFDVARIPLLEENIQK